MLTIQYRYNDKNTAGLSKIGPDHSDLLIQGDLG